MKPAHTDYETLFKEVHRQLALSQEGLARELGVGFCDGQPLGKRPSQTSPARQGAIRSVLLKNDQTREAEALSLSLKWLKPAKGQFQIFYRHGAEHLEYQPDFVAETVEIIFMLESKASNQMEDPIVLAKKEAAVQWCANATRHSMSYDGKPWRYVLIPHNEIAANLTLDALAARFGT